MSLRVTRLYLYNAELRKAQSLKAVLVGELCEAAYDRLEAAAPLQHRQQQYMRIYTAQLLSRIKRVTSECDNQSCIVWLREGTSSLLVEDHTLISRHCMRLLKGELKRRRCLELILVCRLCLAAYELLEVIASLLRGQQRSMRGFTINQKGDAPGRQSVQRCLIPRRDKFFVSRCSTGRRIASKGHTRIL